MCGHHGSQLVVQPLIRFGIFFQDGFQTSFVNGHVYMRVGFDIAMSRKVFATIAHACSQQTLHQAFGQQAHMSWVAVEGAVTNDAAFAVVQIEHRRKAEIHTASAQFGS